MSLSDRSAPLPSGLLLSAARRLLRPLVRLMLRNGLTFPVLADALRQLFIDVAMNEVLTEPKARTDSRISLLTGVHRKEIRRLRELPVDAQDAPEIVTLVGQIVARWVGTKLFLDENGRPRPLPRSHAAGQDGPTFDTLIESVTTDIRPRAVLEDLLGHGLVTLDSEERVQLDTAAFIPRPGGEEQLFYFARNLHDHVAAAVANIGAVDAAPFGDQRQDSSSSDLLHGPRYAQSTSRTIRASPT